MKFEQNGMDRTTHNFELFDKKWLTIFGQTIDAILEDVSELKRLFDAKHIDLKTTIFQCSKYYGSLTHVTRLKVAPNTAGPD